MRAGECAAVAYGTDAVLNLCLEEGTVVEPIQTTFNLCETSADCSELTPDCRTLDIDQNGVSFSYCTRICEPGGEACPGVTNMYESLPGLCLRVNVEGTIDPTASESLCFRPCGEASGCVFGAGGPGNYTGTCFSYEYGTDGPVSACVPDSDY